MHESDAEYLIQPVLNFFIARNFPFDPSPDECTTALCFFHDFVNDPEPYWLRTKTVWVMKTLLDFENLIGACPPTLKEAAIAVVKEAEADLAKRVKKDCAENGSKTVTLDIGTPAFNTLNKWYFQRDWNIHKPWLA
jgi:hypothetical protein